MNASLAHLLRIDNSLVELELDGVVVCEEVAQLLLLLRIGRNRQRPKLLNAAVHMGWRIAVLLLVVGVIVRSKANKFSEARLKSRLRFRSSFGNVLTKPPLQLLPQRVDGHFTRDPQNGWELGPAAGVALLRIGHRYYHCFGLWLVVISAVLVLVANVAKAGIVGVHVAVAAVFPLILPRLALQEFFELADAHLELDETVPIVMLVN